MLVCGEKRGGSCLSLAVSLACVPVFLGVHFHKISGSVCEFLWNMRSAGLQLRKRYGII